MECEYCGVDGKIRVEKESKLGIEVAVCDSCWDLLKNPVTALPLIRSHVTMKLKGSMPPDILKRNVDKYMEMISAWRIRS